MASATLLLPDRARFADIELPSEVARALGRADLVQSEVGERAQLHRQFQFDDEGWSVAALTRSIDVGDTSDATWLRADPCYVRPDINGARMLAYGEGLGLTQQDASAFLPELQTLFVEAGFQFDAPDPARWYLQLPDHSLLPKFSDPGDVLGDDLFDHLPSGDVGMRWRTLLGEVQILMHHHPRNVWRADEGKLPVNSLWFWGNGAPPGQVRSQFACVESTDAIVGALAMLSDVALRSLQRFSIDYDNTLYDLRRVDPRVVVNGWIQPLCSSIGLDLETACCDFSDGAQLRLNRQQRWRFWRRPLRRLS